MRKTLIITVAIVLLVGLASTAAVFALTAFAGEHHGPCARPKPSQLRQVADKGSGSEIEKLARCGR